jgi:WD40 repeat protein
MRFSKLGYSFAVAALVSTDAGMAHDLAPSRWSPPVSLGAPPNTAASEICPSSSSDGKSLFFFSDRPDGLGGNDLWVSQRKSSEDQWGEPRNLGPAVNTPYDDSAAWLSPDGYVLLFTSDRPGGVGALDVWITRRDNRNDDFAWRTPINLGAVNSTSNDQSPAYLIDEHGRLVLYFNSNRPGGKGLDDIYLSVYDRRARRFTSPELVEELSSEAADRLPSPGHLGREMFITSNRAGTHGALDVWVSSRERLPQAGRPRYRWSEPVNLGEEFNSIEVDGCARVSRDGQTLYLHSTRFGGFPLFDLFVSERVHRAHP